MSYVNCIMYGATLPTYSSKKNKDKKEKQDTIKADDPKNRKKVAELIASFK